MATITTSLVHTQLNENALPTNWVAPKKPAYREVYKLTFKKGKIRLF